ncbi:MAG: protein kinase, partial [Myxococcota bacterium]
GIVKGTLCYMSPEQIRSAPLDSRADIFSLGVVMYEMCTTEHPFMEKDLFSIVHKVTRYHPPAPSQIRPNLPPELDSLILSMMAKDRKQRPSSAKQIRHHIEHIMRQNRVYLDPEALAEWLEDTQRGKCRPFSSLSHASLMLCPTTPPPSSQASSQPSRTIAQTSGPVSWPAHNSMPPLKTVDSSVSTTPPPSSQVTSTEQPQHTLAHPQPQRHTATPLPDQVAHTEQPQHTLAQRPPASRPQALTLQTQSAHATPTTQTSQFIPDFFWLHHGDKWRMGLALSFFLLGVLLGLLGLFVQLRP